MRTFVLSLAVSVGFLLLSIRATRRQRLREQSSLFWLGVSVAMVALSLSLPFHLLDRVARLVGIAYPPDLVLLVAVLLLIALTFHLSLHVADLKEKQTTLVQEIGILTASLAATGTGPRPATVAGDPAGGDRDGDGGGGEHGGGGDGRHGADGPVGVDGPVGAPG